jgi:hypothetical protein
MAFDFDGEPRRQNKAAFIAIFEFFRLHVGIPDLNRDPLRTLSI